MHYLRWAASSPLIVSNQISLPYPVGTYRVSGHPDQPAIAFPQDRFTSIGGFNRTVCISGCPPRSSPLATTSVATYVLGKTFSNSNRFPSLNRARDATFRIGQKLDRLPARQPCYRSGNSKCVSREYTKICRRFVACTYLHCSGRALIRCAGIVRRRAKQLLFGLPFSSTCTAAVLLRFGAVYTLG